MRKLHALDPLSKIPTPMVSTLETAMLYPLMPTAGTVVQAIASNTIIPIFLIISPHPSFPYLTVFSLDI